jgi:hypothetical protein
VTCRSFPTAGRPIAANNQMILAADEAGIKPDLRTECKALDSIDIGTLLIFRIFRVFSKRETNILNLVEVVLPSINSAFREILIEFREQFNNRFDAKQFQVGPE